MVTPLFECMECGKGFYSIQAANRAVFGPIGCPKCGGTDIDVPQERQGQPVHISSVLEEVRAKHGF